MIICLVKIKIVNSRIEIFFLFCENLFACLICQQGNGIINMIKICGKYTFKIFMYWGELFLSLLFPNQLQVRSYIIKNKRHKCIKHLTISHLVLYNFIRLMLLEGMDNFSQHCSHQACDYNLIILLFI